jgi:hypothetical protein
MAETLTIRTASSTEVVKIASVGPQGATGQGVPAGGTTGQVLRKVSGTNYDTEWATGGGGASYDQELNTTDSVTFESVTADKVAFDLTAAETAAQGQLAWNADEETLDLGLAHGSVLQVGQETLYHVENSTASAITAGTLCVFSGTVGNSGKLRVAPHANNTNPTAILGVATSTIAAGVGEEGYVTHFGKCRGINASGGAEAWANGDLLYASPTGGLTKTKPSAPIVTVAAVVSNSSSSGTLFVRPSFGQTAADVGAASSTHAASHAAAGSDPLAPSDIGAQSLFTTSSITGATTLSAARAVQYDVANFGSAYDITLLITNSQQGDIAVFRSVNLINANVRIKFFIGPIEVILGTLTAVGQQLRFIYRANAQEWTLVPVDSHPADRITSGTLDIARIPTGTGSTQVALGDHTHGNLTNDGKIGSTSGLPLVTTTAGAVTTLALGTAGQVLTVNSGATGVEFAGASGGGFGEVRFDTATVYTYTGQAAAGASESASVWFIRRSEFSSAGAYVSTTTANNVQWANRLTATYT